MKISQVLCTETIETDFAAETRKAAVNRLVALLSEVRSIDAATAVKDMQKREKIAPTLIPIGSRMVALSHAHTRACKQLVIGLGISHKGIPWDVAGGGLADVVVVIMAPPQMHVLYLKILSRLARLLENEVFMEALMGSASPEEVIDLFAESEKALGEIISGEGLPSFCVLGAGHGGLAMAAHLSISGCRVNLFNRTPSHIEAIKTRGGINVDGEVSGFASLNLISSDPAEAIHGCDVLMLVVPATAHRDIAGIIAPHLQDGQILVLNPGRTGGALEVGRIINQINPRVRPFLAEAQTLLYASRITNPGQVHIFSIKNSVPLAALPNYKIVDILPVVQKALPQFIPGDNVLKTSLNNIGAVFHPAITVLNAGRIEDTHGNFEYYVEGVTPAVATVLEAIDAERVAVAAAMGIRVNTAREWLYLAYDAAGKTLHDAMKANVGYRGIKAPAIIEHRYISEDVPASLVPLASIGELLGVETPMIRSIINIASTMHGVDYWSIGRTVERLGLQGMSVKDIRMMVVGFTTSGAVSSDKPASINREGRAEQETAL